MGMGMEPRALAGIVVYVKDIQRVAAFYAAVLRLEAVEREERFVVLSRTGNCAVGDVSIVAMSDDVAESITVHDPPVIRHETPFKPSFLVESLSDAARVAAEAGGGTKSMGTTWEFRGLRHLDGFDPEGNVLQLVERLQE